MIVRNFTQERYFNYVWITICSIIFCAGEIIGQNKIIPVVEAQIITYTDHDLDHQFTSHKRVQINTQSLHTLVRSPDFDHEIEWQLGNRKITSTLFEHDMRAENYVLELHTASGIKTLPKGPCTTFKGWTAGGGAVRLSITPNSIAGFITDTDGTELYIQPMGSLLKTTSINFVLYTPEEVIIDQNQQCGSGDHHRTGPSRLSESPPTSGRMATCVETEVAIAADYSMFQAYGSNSSTLEAHLLNLKNLQEESYSFYPVEFSIVKTVIVTQSGGDLWSSTTVAGDLLDDFTCWAADGYQYQLQCQGEDGFNHPHDLGELWTNRNFSGYTIGVAWISTVCNSLYQYSVNEDQSALLSNRILISHEQGHNFGANHVSGAYIMNGNVGNASTNFHSSSQTTITNKVNSVSCLAGCSTSNCDDIITVTSGMANSNHEASVMINTSGSLIITTPVTYNAPIVDIVSPLEVTAGTVFEITTNGCNN